MCRVSLLVASAFALLVLGSVLVEAAPWFDWGFTGNRYRPYYPPRGSGGSGNRGGGSGGRSGRDRFRSICRTISADNYAFPGRIPYPSAPLCPY
ncbi:uncharacterized protein LOC124606777 [Schistocerca americana]|uniref:uncharacterized protein LOC124606777 n=1 Tax=Schistocerca americana TaxID=7009 RepID=UPI001F4FEC93|nr:uncharacterized protein LOC124606777 [Schistocerca americana]